MFEKLSVITVAILLASCSSKINQDSSEKVAAPVVTNDSAVESQVQKSDNKHVVYFDTDSAVLTSEAVASLEKIALPMVKGVIRESNGKIVIEGRCDERGASAYNKKLGKKRADAVKKSFVDNGVKAKKISVKSYGEAKPADLAHTEDAWAKNRRAVTISVVM